MARVESLLETMMDKMDWRQHGGLPPLSIAATAKESQPLVPSLSTGSGVQAEVRPLMGKIEILRQRLATMLPCQADVDCLFSSSHGWWLIQQHMMPHLPDLIENDFHRLFNVSNVSKGHPLAIARLLLCIAICIQQLPPEMDMRKFQTTKPLRDMMSDIIDFLVQNVTSDDELIGNIESIECLALQGIYEANAGNLRRSWLSFRKAIAIAQLLGLHRVAVNPSQEGFDSIKTKQRHLWYQVSRGVRGSLLFVYNHANSTRNVTSPPYSAYRQVQAQQRSPLITTLLGSPQKIFTITIYTI
jgi:hypothetical protein